MKKYAKALLLMLSLAFIFVFTVPVEAANAKISDKKIEIYSDKAGTIEKIDALEIGKLSVKLGAGRTSKEDKINHEVGIKLDKLVGDKVKKGDKLCTLYVEKEDDYTYIIKFFEIN